MSVGGATAHLRDAKARVLYLEYALQYLCCPNNPCSARPATPTPDGPVARACHPQAQTTKPVRRLALHITTRSGLGVELFLHFSFQLGIRRPAQVTVCRR